MKEQEFKICCTETNPYQIEDDRTLYGNAIFKVLIYNDGTMWATNGEYGSRIDFCPFCGKPAPKPREWKHDK